MSKFSELLSRPLPSAQNRVFSESALEEGCKTEGGCGTERCGQEGCSTEGGCGTEKCGEERCGDEGVDPSVITDPMRAVVNEPEGEESPAELDPIASQRADDTINAVATPLLVKDELTEAEIDEFVESVDSDIAIAEGFLTEKTIIKFDKNAKRAQLYEVAVAAVAREHHDPLYKKLETVYKMERVLKAKLRKKYHAEATKKVKEYLTRAKKSKSGILSRIASKISGK